jgi:uncharacterized protein YndB with AHSA1/START domain
MSAPIRWRLHLRAPRPVVWEALATDAGRARWWALQAEERSGVVHFRFPDGTALEGRVLERRAPERFVLTYFGGSVAAFDLADDGRSGTDLALTATDLPAGQEAQDRPGWVAALLALKAAVDLRGDLRNHDPSRTWDRGYVDG